MMLKIMVVGTGYVGLSNAVVLSQYNQVCAYDINKNKIKLINSKKLPFFIISLKNVKN